MPSIQGHINDSEDSPQQRSPLLREGERFAIIPMGWMGKLGGGSNPAVFQVLCLHANRDCEAWPSKRLISLLCDLSAGRVQAALRSLEKVGAITLLSVGNGREPSHYRINLSPRVSENEHPHNEGK